MTRPWRPRDLNSRAKYIVDLATGAASEKPDKPDTDLTRAGRKGGTNRAKKLSARRRSEIASAAAKARWSKR